MKICIVGDGGWGTALAMLLLENGHEVVVWGPFEDYLAEIRATGENVRYLPGVKLPRGLTWTSDPAAAAVGAGLVVLATPSHFYRGVCARFAGLVPADADVVSVAKGFCEETRGRLTATAAEALGVLGVAALSGPSHAEEVAPEIVAHRPHRLPGPGDRRGPEEHLGHSGLVPFFRFKVRVTRFKVKG